MVLMVFLSSRISPRTSTVILRERSPLATAVVTSAMLRTWAVRLPAIELTLSVRSFQTPPTPFTTAWPPSLPSVPTSRATRVTSNANEFNCSTIVLMVFFRSRISPFTSMATVFERSPLATALVTSAILRTCAVRLPVIWFTESVKSFQVPATPGTNAWCCRYLERFNRLSKPDDRQHQVQMPGRPVFHPYQLRVPHGLPRMQRPLID